MSLSAPVTVKSALSASRNSSFIRYSVIGATAFVLDFSLMTLGLKLGLSLLVANAIAVIVAIVYSFILHRSFSFRRIAKTNGYKLVQQQQFIRFVLVSLVALGLNELLMVGFVHHLFYRPDIAKVLTSIILLAWNYTVNRMVTFKVN